jgi:hypothetical protein
LVQANLSINAELSSKITKTKNGVWLKVQYHPLPSKKKKVKKVKQRSIGKTIDILPRNRSLHVFLTQF